MAQQGQPYLVPFGQAGMVSHPNRWRAQAGELLLAENVVVENDLVNKEPAATYYDPDGGLEQIFSDMLWTPSSSTDPSLSIWLFYGALPTTVFSYSWTVINGVAGPVTSPWTTTFIPPLPVGSLHFIRITTLSGGATAVTDQRGNTYTLVYDKTFSLSGKTVRGQIWVSVITTATGTSGPSDTLTVTVAPGTANLNAMGSGVLNPLLPLQLRYIATDSGPSSDNFGSCYTSTYPIIGIALAVSSSPTITADFSKTNGFTHHQAISVGAHTLASLEMPTRWGNAKFVTQIEWNSDDVSTFTIPAPGVSVTAGSNRATGPFSSVATGLRPGDTIIIGGESQVVNTYAGSYLDTIAPWETTQSGVTKIMRRAGPVLVSAVNVDPQGLNPFGGFLYKEQPINGSAGAHGNLNVTIQSGLARVRPGRFVVGGKEQALNPRKLFYFNGVDPVQVYPGDADFAAPIAKPAADWGTVQDPSKQPINGIVHADCLWAFGNLNDSHRVYASTPDNHEDFQTTAAPAQPSINFRIASNVGQRLFGGAQFQGVLYLWKYPEGLFYIDDTPSDRLQWTYRIRSMALGCAPSPHAVLATDDDVIFCDAQGHFHLLSAVATLGGTRDSDVTRALGLHTWTDQNVDVSALDTLVSVYDGQTKTAWFGLRSKQAASNNPGDNDLVIRWDFSLIPSGGPLRMTTAREWMPNSLCLKHRNYNGRQAVVIGEAGQCWFVEPGNYGRRTNRSYQNSSMSQPASDVSVGIATQVTLPELDYGDTAPPARPRRKAFRALEIIAQQTNNDGHPVNAVVTVDGVYRQTLNYPQGLNRRRLQPLQCGDGYAITTAILTDGSVVGDVPLIGVIYYYELLGSDQSRKS